MVQPPVMSGQKVAVVTGSNKGVGFGIVRALCKQWDGDVFLTSRDEGRGQDAVKALNKEGLHPKFHQLDITQKSSVEALKTFLVSNYGGLDILVNNAGIAYKQSSTAPFAEQAEVTMATNYTATVNTCAILFPILRSHARVANVSSMVSQWSLAKCSPAKKAQVLAANTVSAVDSLMEEFVNAAKAGDVKSSGWPESAYGMSKVGLTAVSLVQQADIDKDSSREDIVINACCPGYVDTDMTSHKGTKTIDQGAETPTYLALLPPNEKTIRGKFVKEKEVSAWE